MHNQIVYEIITRPQCERYVWEYFQLNEVNLHSNMKQATFVANWRDLRIQVSRLHW